MSGGKRRSGLQITSVTSQTPANQPAPMVGLSVIQSAGSSSCTPQGSSSQPTTPSPKTKYTTHYASCPTTRSSSRFRVVRLAMGGVDSSRWGQPYHRGRWTCTDKMERQEGEGFRRVLSTVRHAHSLESLEMIGRCKDRGRAHLAQSVKGRDGTGLVLHSGPPSPTDREPDNLRLLDCKQPVNVQPSTPASPLPGQWRVSCPLRLDVDQVGWASPPLAGTRHPSLTPIQTPAAFTLDQTIVNQTGDTSSSSNRLMAIDNKIDQAMDLVKSHLMLAVREEVELLREQIRELQERNQLLERENLILRTLKDTT